MIEFIFPYLLKASGILLLFFGAYNLFLSRETFYAQNRHFLLVGLLAAFTLPLFPIPNYITVSSQTVLPIDSLPRITTTTETETGINPLLWFAILYGIGVLACIGILIRQFISLYRIYRQGRKYKDGGYTFISLGQDIAPFSFFNMIFYSKHSFSEKDMASIIAHEKAHCQQWHSLDIILSKLTASILWFNPFAWLYHKNIIQNLEFLADDAACHDQPVKSYQYTLLKATSRHLAPALTNSFYNSLIKKRIVMLHQSRSKRTNLFKLGLILPALALFLWSFNTVDVYVPTVEDPFTTTLSDGKSIEITINSKTTNAELEDIKKDLKSKGIDFSYTAVRNEDGEIIDLELQVNSEQDGKSVSGSSTFNNDGKPIDPVRILINDDHGTMLFMGKDEGHNMTMIHEGLDRSVWVHKGDGDHKKIEVIKEKDGDKETTKILVDGEEISEEEYEKLKEDNKIMKKRIKKHKDGEDSDGKSVFIMKDSDEDIEFFGGSGEEKRIEVIKMGDDEDSIKIIVDGEEMSEEEYEKMKGDDKVIKKRVKVRKGKGGKDKNVFIMKDSDDEHDIEVIEDDGSGFMFIDVDGDGDEPLFIIDGKESSRKDVKALGPKNIETIEVLKGEAAEKKYGKKAKDGVVEITTKKNKE